jgi:hypothetical protein
VSTPILKTVIVASALTAMTFASSAFGYCFFSGKVGRTYATQVGSSDFAYFYVYPETGTPYTSSYSYYGSVEGYDEALLSTLSSANAGDLTIYCRGSSASCGTGSYRWAGSLDYCYTYQHR